MNEKLLLIILLLLPCFAANAQQNKLSGTIKNSRNEPLAQVTVTLLNTNWTVQSNIDGQFDFPTVPAGKLSLRCSALGYATIIISTGVGKHLQLVLRESSTRLDEVTVSAQKTEENARNVPASISVFSGTAVSDYRIQTTRDLSALVPNLYSSNPGDGRNITSIRGVTTTSYDPAVATYIDGVNQFGLDTYISTLLDVDRIEVLRGPQGTLYGRNAMGGVINIVTKQPGNYMSGFAGIDIGNQGQKRYSMAIRIPLLKNKLFLSSAGLYNKQNGFYTNEYNGKKFDQLHGYLGSYNLKFLASSRFVLSLNVKHQENRNNGAFPLAGSVAEALAKPFTVNQNATAEMVDNLFNASLVANYTGEDFNFTAQSAYQANYRYYKQGIDGDFSPLDGAAVLNNYGRDWNRVQVYSQELRFSSPASNASKFKWLGGLYGFYQKNPIKQGTYFGADAAALGAEPFTTAVNINDSKAAGIAAFGQVSYQLMDQLEITAGLRYDQEHKETRASGQYLIPDMASLTTQSDTLAKANFHAITPKLSLRYSINTNHTIYASYNRGFRAGGITQLASDPSVKPLDAYKPEYSSNLEAGSKNVWFDQRLSASLALFYINITDAQIPVLILPDALTTTRNAGKLRSKGMEIEFSGKPVKGLSVDYNFGYTHATYKALDLSQGGEMVDLSGNKQIYTPEMTSMLALQYSYGLDHQEKKHLIARGEWLYTGKQYYDLGNQIEQKGYPVYHAKLGLSAQKYELFIWGRNVFNKTYVDYAYDFGAAHLGNPRTYGLSLLVRFTNLIEH